MKKLALLLAWCFFITIVFVPYAKAQENEAPTMFMVSEEFVSIDNMSAFWNVQSEAVELMKQHVSDVTWYAYQTNAGSFYWVLPIRNFAGIDELYTKSQKIHKTLLENDFDPEVKFRDLSTVQQSVIMWDKELSYHPGGEFGQTAEKPYCEWLFMYLKSGHEKEAAAALKKWHAFYDSVEESYDWDVYKVILGPSQPCWILMARAESELGMVKNDAELEKKYSEKFMELRMNMALHMTRIEEKTGWFMPNWSLNWEAE